MKLFQSPGKTLRSKAFEQYTAEEALRSAFYDTLPESDANGPDRGDLLQMTADELIEKAAPYVKDFERLNASADEDRSKTLWFKSILALTATGISLAATSMAGLPLANSAAAALSFGAAAWVGVDVLNDSLTRKPRSAQSLTNSIESAPEDGKNVYQVLGGSRLSFRIIAGHSFGSEEMIRNMPAGSVAEMLAKYGDQAASAIEKANTYAANYGYGEEFVSGMKEIDEQNGTSWSGQLSTAAPRFREQDQPSVSEMIEKRKGIDERLSAHDQSNQAPAL